MLEQALFGWVSHRAILVVLLGWAMVNILMIDCHRLNIPLIIWIK